MIRLRRCLPARIPQKNTQQGLHEYRLSPVLLTFDAWLRWCSHGKITNLPFGVHKYLEGDRLRLGKNPASFFVCFFVF